MEVVQDDEIPTALLTSLVNTVPKSLRRAVPAVLHRAVSAGAGTIPAVAVPAAGMPVPRRCGCSCGCFCLRPGCSSCAVLFGASFKKHMWL